MGRFALMKCKHFCKFDVTNKGMTDTFPSLWIIPPMHYIFPFLIFLMFQTWLWKSLSFVADSCCGIDRFYATLHAAASDDWQIKTWPAPYYWPTHCALMSSSSKVFFIIVKWGAGCPRQNGKFLKVVKGIGGGALSLKRCLASETEKKKNITVTVESLLKQSLEVADEILKSHWKGKS